MRNDCPINFHLSKLCIAKFSILYDISLWETERENWSWSLLGAKGLTDTFFVVYNTFLHIMVCSCKLPTLFCIVFSGPVVQGAINLMLESIRSLSLYFHLSAWKRKVFAVTSTTTFFKIIYIYYNFSVPKIFSIVGQEVGKRLSLIVFWTSWALFWGYYFTTEDFPPDIQVTRCVNIQMA